MATAFFIAKRYFAAGTKRHLIYRMGLIACISVAISTTALLVVLSVFNGLEGVIRQLFYAFDPDLKVELKEGTYFSLPPAVMDQVVALPGVEKVVEVLEENALFVYNGKQLGAKLKGVSNNFIDKSALAPHILRGKLQLNQDGKPCALIGLGIQHALSISINNILQDLQVFCPRHTKMGVTPMQKIYTTALIRPGAIFSIEKKFDDNYVLVSIDFVKKLLDNPDYRTSLEIQVQKDFSIATLQEALQRCLPSTLVVRNRDQQQVTLLRTLHVERLLVLLTFALIVLVASLNIFFILSMVVLAKRTDIAILHTIGMQARSIKNIFILEGLLIGLAGALLGMAMAGLLTWLQERFGFVSLGMQTSLIKAYPVKRHVSDFVGVGIGVFVTTLLASYKPALLAKQFILRPKNYL